MNAHDTPKPLLDALFDDGLLIPSGVDGLYGRSGLFEDVIDRLTAAVTRLAAGDGAERIHFPPAMPRAAIEKSGYLKSFPHLAGCVHAFMGGEADHMALLARLADGEDWTGDLKATDVVLTPAACYPLYPAVARRGALADGGVLFDLTSYCFRHEPSKEPTRMQLFRMREFVRIGAPEDVVAFRRTWLDRARDLAEALRLPAELDVANDPFFGRAGKMLANNQRDSGLKFELLVPVNDGAAPTACMSFNYHQDHFGTLWEIRRADGGPVHSACVGFGLERLTLALFRTHGLDVDAWPATVRSYLWGHDG
jgi:seryl-tRNA synthetase